MKTTHETQQWGIRSVSFWMILPVALGIIFVGAGFIVNPSSNAAGFGTHLTNSGDLHRCSLPPLLSRLQIVWSYLELTAPQIYSICFYTGWQLYIWSSPVFFYSKITFNRTIIMNTLLILKICLILHLTGLILMAGTTAVDFIIFNNFCKKFEFEKEKSKKHN